MSERLPGTEELLAEHSRLLARQGPDSPSVYDFEMDHLANAEFLRRAIAEKQRWTQQQHDQHCRFYLGLVVVLTTLIQFGSLYYILFRHLH